jgi:hypothetical protein
MTLTSYHLDLLRECLSPDKGYVRGFFCPPFKEVLELKNAGYLEQSFDAEGTWYGLTTLGCEAAGAACYNCQSIENVSIWGTGSLARATFVCRACKEAWHEKCRIEGALIRLDENGNTVTAVAKKTFWQTVRDWFYQISSALLN